MTDGAGDLAARASDAALAVALWAADPMGLGGMLLHGPPDPVRDRVLAWIPRLLPRGSPIVPLPLGVTDDRLLGGVALAETLAAGRVVREQGLLARAHGGVVVARMAERMEPRVAAHVTAALDFGSIAVERDGASEVAAARFGLIALDESYGSEDAQVPAALADRCALRLDLMGLGVAGRRLGEPDVARVSDARSRAPLVAVPGAVVEALVATGAAFGISSLRAVLLAVAAARAHAALRGQMVVAQEDAEAAARLVLAWRAARIPAAPEGTPTPETDDHTPEAPPSSEGACDAGAQPARPGTGPDETMNTGAPAPLEELLVDAVKSGIPSGLLASVAAGFLGRPARGTRAGRVGLQRMASRGGRPAGVRVGAPRHGERLHVVETVRAAAPWQQVRRRDLPCSADARRVLVRGDDFRVANRTERSETCVIFCVDASGSSALQRLAEAKGAIERILLDCYARRDHVALIAFRKDEARLVLPPTRSLTRVRKGLAALAGGGATPLAAGIDAARTLANDVSRRGQLPVIVLMTDARGNLAPDGSHGAAAGARAAMESARAVRAAAIPALFLDTAPRPRDPARLLAQEMNARYLPLPFLEEESIARHVHQLAARSGGAAP